MTGTCGSYACLSLVAEKTKREVSIGRGGYDKHSPGLAAGPATRKVAGFSRGRGRCGEQPRRSISLLPKNAFHSRSMPGRRRRACQKQPATQWVKPGIKVRIKHLRGEENLATHRCRTSGTRTKLKFHTPGQ
jgi:hypothetical protein